jgi:hypothetical protein
MTDVIVLAECPFCTCRAAELETVTDGNFIVESAHVECPACLARGPEEVTEERAVQAWNACSEGAALRISHQQSLLDTERLNWLDSVNTRTNQRVGTSYGWKFDINHNRAALSDHNLPALHVRAAIDAARKRYP